jgi:preprotein translocase subunit SecF
VTKIRNELTKPLNGKPIVKQYGSPKEVLIRTDAKGNIREVQSTIMSTLNKIYPHNSAKVEKTDTVGPKFAKDLRSGALEAVIFSIIVIFIYILIRFKNWTYSLGATLALAHDVIMIAGIYALFYNIAPFSMQIDQTMIGAFLTIIGYSLNDTVIVFDRIREYRRKRSTMDYLEMVNAAINDTLSRTIITALTTFFTIFVLFFFGGQALKGFAFGMMLGVLLGTYSSIFVASGIAVELNLRLGKETKSSKKRRRRVKQAG